MKTLLVAGKDPVPAGLRDIVARGSTSLDEISAEDLRTYVARTGLGVDRLVLWAGASDPDIRTLAWNYFTTAGAEQLQRAIFVTATPGEPLIAGMTPEDVFVWPRDEDKLKLVFRTAG